MTISDKRFSVDDNEFLLPVVDFVSNINADVVNLAQDFYDILGSAALPEIVNVIKAGNLKDLIRATAEGKTKEYVSKFGATLENGILSVKKKVTEQTTSLVKNYANAAGDVVVNNINRSLSSPTTGATTAINNNTASSGQSFDLGNFLKNFGGGPAFSTDNKLPAADAISLSSLLSDITSGAYKASVHDSGNNAVYLTGLVKTAANNNLNGFYTALADMCSDQAKLDAAGITKNDVLTAGIASLRDAAGRGDVNTVIEIGRSALAPDIRSAVPGIVSELYDLFPPAGDIPEAQTDAYYQKLRSALTILDPSWSSAKPVAGYFDQRVTKNTASFLGIFPIAAVDQPATYSFTVGDPKTTAPELAAAKVVRDSPKNIQTTQQLVTSFYEGGA